MKTIIIDGRATNTTDGNVEEMFVPEVAAQFVDCPNFVMDGWIYANGEWSAPTNHGNIPGQNPSDSAPKVSPVEFKLLFTPQERVAIKAARATDLMIDDFYDIVEDPRLTFVDLGLQSTQDALSYMVAQGLLTAERRSEILAGAVL